MGVVELPKPFADLVSDISGFDVAQHPGRPANAAPGWTAADLAQSLRHDWGAIVGHGFWRLPIVLQHPTVAIPLDEPWGSRKALYLHGQEAMLNRGSVGIAGFAGAGKDTFARFLQEGSGGAFHWDSFAAPLRKLSCAVLGVSLARREEIKDASIEALGGRTMRSLEQTIGTDWGQRMVNPKVWVQSLAIRAPKGARTLVSDIRFEDEGDLVRESGGALIHIRSEANARRRKLPPQSATHCSEDGIQEKDGDLVVWNDASLASLKDEAYNILGSVLVPEAAHVDQPSPSAPSQSEPQRAPRVAV
ncbi:MULTISPECIES: hypothetical protein [unclassified Thioalkalivibrio]|uniref:deoxynucleotide monophosphate kinase family protein n=1 Tax=unclassified Thioalkalivibrio TaxID=2621013 RepID=UPI0003727F3E|nr:MULTISPECIES: hypothetical protein [unclassified Thioalkalivibrio]